MKYRTDDSMFDLLMDVVAWEKLVPSHYNKRAEMLLPLIPKDRKNKLGPLIEVKCNSNAEELAGSLLNDVSRVEL